MHAAFVVGVEKTESMPRCRYVDGAIALRNAPSVWRRLVIGAVPCREEAPAGVAAAGGKASTLGGAATAARRTAFPTADRTRSESSFFEHHNLSPARLADTLRHCARSATGRPSRLQTSTLPLRSRRPPSAVILSGSVVTALFHATSDQLPDANRDIAGAQALALAAPQERESAIGPGSLKS